MHHALFLYGYTLIIPAFFHTTGALQFESLASPPIAGHEVNVTWISSLTDPVSFKLDVACEYLGISRTLLDNIVQTKTLHSAFTVPMDVVSTPPSQCTLEGSGLGLPFPVVLSITFDNSTIAPPLLTSSNPLESKPSDSLPSLPPSSTSSTSFHSISQVETDTAGPLSSSAPSPTPPPRSTSSLSDATNSTTTTSKIAISAPVVTTSSGLVSSLSPIDVQSASPSPSLDMSSLSAEKQPTGAIVGGVIGGVMALVLVITAVCICRRSLRRRHPHVLDLQLFPGTVRSSPSVSEKARFGRAGDRVMYPKEQDHSRLVSPQTSPRAGGMVDGPNRLSPLEMKDPFNASPTAQEPYQGDRIWEKQDNQLVTNLSTASDDNRRKFPNPESMSPIEREQRQQELLDRMRRVLDGEE